MELSAQPTPIKSSRARTFGLRANYVAFTVRIAIWFESFERFLSFGTKKPKAPPISPSRRSSPVIPPKILTPRERSIEGFCKRYAELISDGDDLMADYIADQAYRMSQMTEEEYEAHFADSINE